MSNDCISEGRIGKFRLNISLVREGDASKLLALFGNFIILETWASAVTNTIEYTAYSPMFGAIKQGDVIPSYQLAVYTEYTDEGKVYTFSAVKSNESSTVETSGGGEGAA